MALTRPKYSNIVDTDYKASCRVVTTTNITLSGGAPSSYDGVNLVLNDRILVAGQSTGSQNGIYIVQTVGTGSDGTWIRSFDANASDRVTAGMTTAIEEGTNVGKTWRLTTGNPIVLGSTSLAFADSSGGGASVAGSNRSIQYNDNGVSGGGSDFLYFSANGNVVVGSTTPATIANTGALTVKGGISVAGNIVPAANISYNLGSESLRFKDLFLSGNSIFIGSETISVNNGTFAFTSNGGAQTGNVFLGNVDTSGKIIINDSTNATPYVMGSGAFHVVGGMSIGKDFWVGGNIYVANVISQSTTILEVNEPLVYLDASDFPYNYDIGVFSDFIGGSANTYQYTGAVRSYQTNEWVFFSNLKTAPGGGIVSITSADVLYDPVKAGNIVAANTTPSTSTTTGALIVRGGAGIGGALFTGGIIDAAGNIIADSGTASTSTTTGALVVNGGAGVGGRLNVGGNIIADSGTASTSTTSGALVVAGGAGIAGNLNVGGNLNTGANIVLFGTNARCIIGSNVSVGTSAAALQIVQTTNSALTIATTNTPTINSSFAGIDGWAYDGSTNFAAATINFRAAESWTTTNHGSLIQFRTTANGVAGTLSERVRIESSGNVVVTGGWIIPSGNVSQNLGSSTQWWNLVYGRSVQAQYADLAENYVTDKIYVPGTVVVFGGDAEITATTTDHDPRVAGVISTDPAYLMNAATTGQPVALTGRVPCMVLGPVDKGDRLVTSKMSGVAQRLVDGRYTPGCIFAKSLEKIERSEVKLIEVAVGRD
jgi:hypothetical protein